MEDIINKKIKNAFYSVFDKYAELSNKQNTDIVLMIRKKNMQQGKDIIIYNILINNDFYRNKEGLMDITLRELLGFENNLFANMAGVPMKIKLNFKILYEKYNIPEDKMIAVFNKHSLDADCFNLNEGQEKKYTLPFEFIIN